MKSDLGAGGWTLSLLGAGGWGLGAGYLLLAVVVAGCKPQAPATPEASYRAFVEAAASAHVARSDKPLLDAFDTATRDALAARAKAAAAATGKTLADDAAYQALLGGPMTLSITAIQTVQTSDDAATLQIAVDGGPGGSVKMVREQGRWRIHLDALDLAAPLDAGPR